MADLASQVIEVTLVAHPIIAVSEMSKANFWFSTAKRCRGGEGERESLIHFQIARLEADAKPSETDRGPCQPLNDVRGGSSSRLAGHCAPCRTGDQDLQFQSTAAADPTRSPKPTVPAMAVRPTIFTFLGLR